MKVERTGEPKARCVYSTNCASERFRMVGTVGKREKAEDRPDKILRGGKFVVGVGSIEDRRKGGKAKEEEGKEETIGEGTELLGNGTVLPRCMHAGG
jgi:hypothetical protein